MSGLPQILEDHFARPRNVGRLASASSRGRGSNPACGDTLEIEIRSAEGRVEDARFMAHGCSSVIAVASLAVDTIRGQSLDSARGLELESLVATAGGLPENRRHALAVVARALNEALGARP
jgi:NifU-like protein